MTARKVPLKKIPVTLPVETPDAQADLDGAAVIAALAGIISTALQGTTGAIASAAGLTASDNQNKVDVNVPELITSLNGMVMQQAVNHGHALQLLETQMIGQVSFFADLARSRASDHRDQNHTQQLLAQTPPFADTGDLAEESNDDTDRS
jgi:ERCC4-related helicase